MVVGDEVITKVSKAGIPKGTFGIVESVDKDGIWVDVFIPADADIPEDTILYSGDELELQWNPFERPIIWQSTGGIMTHAIIRWAIMSYPSLRPHHGMCFQFYEGKGYSPDFTDHMGKVIEAFEDAPQQEVRIITATDIVCENCPNNDAGVCVSQDKVTRYDEEVLKACRISDGEMMPYSEFLTLVKERIINRNLRSTICSDCSWDYICREKEPNPNSGIHLSTL